MVDPATKADAEAVLDSSDLIAAGYARVAELERRHNLLELELDGWKVWPLLRFSATARLCGLKFGAANPKTNFSRRDLLVNAGCDALRILFPDRAKCVALCASTNRRESVQGKWKDVYFDDIILGLGSTLKVEKPHNKLIWNKRKTALIRSGVSTFPLQLALRFYLRASRIPEEIRGLAAQLHAILKNEPELHSFSESAISTQLASFRWNKAMYRRIFAKTGARLLLSADGYGEHEMIAAAKELGMRVVELQHGVVFPRGPEYFWPAAAAPLRAKLPIADELLVYGEYWRSVIDPENFWGNRLIPIGSVMLDQTRARPFLPFPSRHTELKVVFTSTGLEATETCRFLKDTLALIPREASLHIVIKLHPCYDPTGDVYRSTFAHDPRVTVLRADQTPATFDLIKACDCHVTASYSCAYDSLGLGKVAVILPFTGWKPLQHLVTDGQARLAESPARLVELLYSKETHSIPPSTQEFFYRHGALDAALEHLRPILHNSGAPA